MSSRELVTLGTGSILPHGERSPSGYALKLETGATAWLDAGPGTLARHGHAGLSLETLEHVLLTHFHPDHCLDLAALCFARRNPALREAPPLTVHGPRGTATLLANLQKVWGGWVRDESVQVHEIEPDERFATNSFSVQARPTHHTDHALCYRITFADGFTLTYSGDSDAVAELEEAARDADLFLCECSFPDEDYVEGHLTPRRAAEVAERAGARTLLLTHFYPSLDAERAVEVARSHFSGAVSAARDQGRHALTRTSRSGSP